MPKNNEVFGLALDPVIAPLDMVRKDGYDPIGWSHHGTIITVPQTDQFMFVSVGYQPNLDAVIKALRSHGTIPPGQWREAIRAIFEPDGIHPVGIADPSWGDPGGYAGFPCLGGGGSSGFGWAGDDRSEDWRWLVRVSVPLEATPLTGQVMSTGKFGG